jgi:heme A synthase
MMEVNSLMETIVEIHRVISNSTVLFFLLLGLWGVVRAIRNRGVEGSYLGAMVIAELLFVLQAILGAVLMLGDARPGRIVHLIYGTFALVALPGLFAYLKGDDSNQAQWYYAIAVLFLFGIALRAIGTGV